MRRASACMSPPRWSSHRLQATVDGPGRRISPDAVADYNRLRSRLCLISKQGWLLAPKTNVLLHNLSAASRMNNSIHSAHLVFLRQVRGKFGRIGGRPQVAPPPGSVSRRPCKWRGTQVCGCFPLRGELPFVSLAHRAPGGHLPRLLKRITSLRLFRAAADGRATVSGTVWQRADRLGTLVCV